MPRIMKAIITMIIEMILNGMETHATIAMSVIHNKFEKKSFIIILE